MNKTQADPLFIAVGGPGGSAVRSAAQYMPYFRQIQKKRDIVFVDQRGTGGSQPLDCAFMQGGFLSLTDLDRQTQLRQVAKACVAGYDVDLRHFTTPFAADDLDNVRRYLGYTEINLWGVSYGSRVALEFMRRYPDRVRAAVLDGAAPVAIALPQWAAVDASAALARLFELCANQGPCDAAYGDLAKRWVQLMDQVADSPRTIQVHHPRTQQLTQMHLSAATVSSWMQLALYSREFAPLIPLAVHRATEGEYQLLAGVALLAMDEMADSISQGMQAAVLCAEDRQFHQYPQFALQTPPQSLPLLHMDRPEVVDQLCESFPTGHLPENYFAPVAANTPTLVLSGALDPVTPPRWGAWVADQLPNAHHLVVEHAHHGVTMQGCLPRVVHDFIAQGNAQGLDTTCAARLAPPAFFIDAAGPAMVAGAQGDAE